jgi:hypothetical protein
LLLGTFVGQELQIFEKKSFLEVVSDFSTEITLRRRDSSEGLRQLPAGVF